ncbi:MAG: DUF2066 domain-containing protein [Xanthomonadales bacterium]|nr:DUF2066 domain-containing protein [Xanthomonadales bacterium]
MKKLLLIIVTLNLSATQAVADINLYSGEVVVASKSEADRNGAVPVALVQVLQKLSGQREIPSSPVLENTLNNAPRLLRSYRYARVDRTAADGAETQELRLVAQFMQPEVDRIVQQIGMPRWRQERPEVQLWVVIDDGRNRQLKPLEFDYAWESMEEIATMRGLPVGWPDLDEEEVQLIDMRLVWGGFTDYLVERGAPQDGVAIVSVRREGPQWTVRWNLTSGGQNWSWQNSDLELMYALAEGTHRMADQIAASTTIAVSDQGSAIMDVRIGGLNNAEAYVSCLEYLQDLSLVNAVEILGADPGRVHFRLQLNASREHLSEAFERGSVLLPASAGSDYEYEFLH